MKIKFCQKCLIVAMTVAVLTATFVATAFALPIDQTSHTEYFLPYVVEFRQTSSTLGNFMMSNLTTVSNQPNGDVTSYFNFDEDDIYITKEYNSVIQSVTDIWSPTFTFETLVLKFKDYYKTGGPDADHTEILEVSAVDTNGDEDWNGTITATWNEEYYDSTNNYQHTIETHSEVFSNDSFRGGRIAVSPYSLIEHLDPIEQSTITDFTLTFNCQFGLGAFEISGEPLTEDSVRYGYNYPPNIIPQVVNPNVIEWLTTSLNSFMNAEIFGNGITIGTVLGIAVATPLVIWFLKLLAGG